MDLLVEAIKKFVITHGLDRVYWIAYSGGLDSHVLLHLFATVRSIYPIKLRAIYINHGISTHAAHWALHCAAVCSDLQIDFTEHSISVTADQKNVFSPEDSLRQLRYQCFAELLAPDDALLTAHHQDDQAETVLLQLFRGAGPKGLAAMPRIKSFAQGLHGRPLLDFTRRDLKTYAKQHHLQWVEDESNACVHYTRNFLRHDVLPILLQRWPAITKTLARTADHCAQTQQIIESIIDHDMTDVQGATSRTLSVEKLLRLPQNKQAHVLRTWLLQFNFPLPSMTKMQQLLHDVLLARDDKMPCVAWRGVEIRRYRDELFCLSTLAAQDAAQSFHWNLSEPLCLMNGTMLQATLARGQGLHADIQQVSVRFRQGGEKLRLPGRAHHHDLKKLFQGWGVPPWQRNRVPLIYVENQLAAVVGFCVAQDFVVRDQQQGWLLALL